MDAFYFEIRLVHIGAVVASGGLFLVRGAAFNLLRAGWPMAWPVRTLSYAIDTTLLTAALMLMTIVRQYPFADAWLTTKVVLLIVYVWLGYMALRGGTREVRLASLAAASMTYLFIIGVARAHDPFGVFA
jgi:uncharacterized membrane protein SirB2